MKFLFALFTLIAFAAPTFADEINVCGEGTVKMTPDIASISVSVVTESKTVSETMSLNSAAANKLYDKLASFNIDKKDIQTTNFSVQSNYDRNGRPTGTYSVVNSVNVTIRDLPKLGTILDGLATDNTIRFGNIDFGVSDTQAATDKARALAVVDAHRTAIDLAHLSGLFCGKATRITETTYMPHNYADASFAAAPGGGRGSPISGGQLTIKVNVSITYQLVDFKRDSVPTQTMPLLPQD